MSGYSSKYQSNDLELQETVRKYCEVYNDRIDFTQYYHLIWKEALPGHGKTKCKLHDEQTGESFSYKAAVKFWSCWGACKVNAGGIVEYHLKYLQKTSPSVNIIGAIRDLYRIYPFLPPFKADRKKKAGDGFTQGLQYLERQLNTAHNLFKREGTVILRRELDLVMDTYTIFLGDRDLIEQRYLGLDGRGEAKDADGHI